MNEIMQTWSDPHARHAMLVHWPIVLGIIGVVPAMMIVVTRFKSLTWKLAAIACMAGAAVGAGLAAGAGEEAEHRVEGAVPLLSSAEEEAVERHEELGEGGWKWPAGAAVLLSLTLVPARPVRAAGALLGMAACIGVAVWVARTAHTGGRIVYVHGVGVPQRQVHRPAAGAPATDPADRGDESDDAGSSEAGDNSSPAGPQG